MGQMTSLCRQIRPYLPPSLLFTSDEVDRMIDYRSAASDPALHKAHAADLVNGLILAHQSIYNNSKPGFSGSMPKSRVNVPHFEQSGRLI